MTNKKRAAYINYASQPYWRAPCEQERKLPFLLAVGLSTPSRMTIRPFTGMALSASVKPLPSLVDHATPMSVQRAFSPSPVTLNKRWLGRDLVVVSVILVLLR
jgi:hypothetical protein